MLDRALRAENSTLKTRTSSWLRRVYDMDSWDVRPTSMSSSGVLGPRVTSEEGPLVRAEETWLRNLLVDSPDLLAGYEVTSTFFTNAPEINAKPSEKEATYNFRNCDSWYGVGLQILVAAEWRPDCVQAVSWSVKRTLPPRLTRGGNWLTVVSAGALRWDHTIRGDVPRPQNTPDNSRAIEIEVVTFYVHGYATSCSYT